MPNELRGEWALSLSHLPDVVWPILSDTERFNEMSGLPRYVLTETPQADGTVRRVALGRVAHYDVQWEELPVEWVTGQYFFQRRSFLNGPLQYMDATLTLAPNGYGADAFYRIAIASRTPVLGPYVAGRLIKGAYRTFSRAVQGAEEFLNRSRPAAYDLGPPALAEGAELRAQEIQNYLVTGPYDHGLSQRLVDMVLKAPAADACRLRPKQLAREWAADQRHAVEICLAAVRSGLLRLTWDSLCPRCRGVKASTDNLETLTTHAHCASCNVDFSADFNKNVELVFHPSSTLRDCPTGEYCLSGPQTTPHVLVQQSLAPGDARRIDTSLPPGEYRVRTFASGSELDFTYAGGDLPEIVVTPEGIILRETNSPGILALVNETQRPLVLVIESREWLRDALTAHQVTALHTFRHLFPNQVLRAGEEMSIDSVTLMFTDLQGSTALYREIGDGPAYQQVREHFDFLSDIALAHNGAVIKTIGDAVMVAFSDPAQALNAALAAQEKITAFNHQKAAAMNLKIGLHYGRCIVVNLNDRLDYFGSTVNLAARLQAQSKGGDIVLSDVLGRDLSLAPLLNTLPVTYEVAQLRGFDQPTAFLRIAAKLT